MRIQNSNYANDDITTIKTLRRKIIYSRLIFIGLLIFLSLAIILNHIPFSLEIFVGVITAVIAFELGLLRYDYLKPIQKFLGKN